MQISTAHFKFVTPTSTLEFWYLCMVDFANFKDTVSLYRKRPALDGFFVSLYGRHCKIHGHSQFAAPKSTVDFFVLSWHRRLCKLQGHCKFVTPMSTLELLYLCKVDFANIKDTVWLQRQCPPLNFCIFVRSTLQTLISF